MDIWSFYTFLSCALRINRKQGLYVGMIQKTDHKILKYNSYNHEFGCTSKEYNELISQDKGNFTAHFKKEKKYGF